MTTKINKIRCVDENGNTVDAEFECSCHNAFELIKTVNITEDTRFVVIDTDNNGNPFELKAIQIFAHSVASENSNSSSSVQMFIGADSEKYPIEGEFNTDFARISVSSAVPSPKTTPGRVIDWATGFEVYGIGNCTEDHKVILIRGTRFIDIDTIKKVPSNSKGIHNISIEVYTSDVWFGAGSTIKVYGVRA